MLEEVVPSLNAEHDHGVLILVDLVNHPVGLESEASLCQVPAFVGVRAREVSLAAGGLGGVVVGLVSGPGSD